ncbi:hypothetical protein L1049_023929 [Liquidambar formosana]|uniref:Uncharacterized protein n=1 Tax=Liquidambar formosana TaxID=63359 RepID=A0AAP0WZ46_LIQFO
MFRALRTKRSCRGYDRLADGLHVDVLEAKLERVTSLPARISGSSKKSRPKLTLPGAISQVKHAKKLKKSHPLFSLFDARPKKTTAKPEFARYLEYAKEGGVWDVNSNMPVLYFK